VVKHFFYANGNLFYKQTNIIIQANISAHPQSVVCRQEIFCTDSLKFKEMVWSLTLILPILILNIFHE
jgi:hypothetical protein